MVKCLRESENPTKSSKAMGRGLRVHFKPDIQLAPRKMKKSTQALHSSGIIMSG